MSEKFYPEIGNVLYIKNVRSKRLTIRVKSDSSVTVTMPFLSTLKSAESFLLSRIDWICKAQQKTLEKKPVSVFVEDIQNVTRFHNLTFKLSPDTIIRGRIKNNTIIVLVPAILEKNNPKVQEFVLAMIKKALVAEAKEYLPARVQELANVHKFKFIDVKITSAQTRWGSCTFQNSINFSCFIMRLPTELIDFIIVHELCHTVHKNHGPKFHQLLDHCSDGKKKDFEKELKNYRIR